MPANRCSISSGHPGRFGMEVRLFPTYIWGSGLEATKPPAVKSIIIVRAHLITTSSFLGREIEDGQMHLLCTRWLTTVRVQQLDISANSQWELMGANQHTMTVKVPVTLQGLQFVSTFKSCLSERLTYKTF
jgi:hypothetical protein